MSDLPPGVSAPGESKPFIPQVKRGPGRPRKDSLPKTATPTPTRASNKDDVERALATMDALYGALGAALLFGPKLPRTAGALADKREDLQTANKNAFEASPQLARLIAGAAPIASVSTFFIAHITVAAGLVMVARNEIADKRENSQGDDGTSTP